MNNINKKIFSLRKCIGCNQMKSKDKLVRFVLDFEKDEVIQDYTMKRNGRGAYICKDFDCIKRAQKARKLEKIFSGKIQENFYEKIDICE